MPSPKTCLGIVVPSFFARRSRWSARWTVFLLAGLACWVSLGLSLATPLGLAQDNSGAPQARAPAAVSTDSATVTLGDQALFTVQRPQSAKSAQERAARISARLTTIANDQAIPVEAIALSDTEFGTAIYAEDTLIMAIDDGDVAGTGLTPKALAAQHLATIQRQMPIYRAERSAEYLSRAAGIAFFCTLGLVLAILVLANAMPQFYRWLDRQQDRWMPNVRLQNFELLTASQLTGLVRVFTQVLHFALVSGLILVYLSYVLSLFPQTRRIGQGVFSYVLGAVKIVWDGFIAYLPNLLSIAIILVIASSLIREQHIPIVVQTTITLGYDVPWKLVHETMIAAAEATSYILKEPPPYVWQTSLDDFYVSYQIRAATTHPEVLGEIYSELHQNLQDYCNRAGIEIMSPHYGAMRDGNQSTMPANYLPENYQAPPWNLPSGWPPK